MIEEETRVGYTLHPRQQHAMELMGWTEEGYTDRSGAVQEMLYGGSPGGGKSHLTRALAAAIGWGMPGSVSAFFRRTYAQLEENMIRRWKVEVPDYLGSYSETKREFTWGNGSITEFRHCDNEDDALKYLSAEWEALLIDEATTFTPFQIGILRSRVRSTRPDWWETILYTANPGGPGHTYFLDNFVDPGELGNYQPWKAPREDGGLNRAFLRARLEDNPSLDARYGALIEAIPDPVLREAYKTGDWHLFAGQFFTTWRFDKHVIDPFMVPKHWRKWGALDWGFASPLSFGIYSQDPDTKRIYKIRQLYAKELTNAEAVERIKALRGDWVLDVVLADPSMWIRKSEQGKSTADDYAARGVSLQPANNSRIVGWQALHGVLDDLPDGQPGFQVFRNCYDTWRTFPLMQRDDNDPEDMNTKLEDHAADETRYALSGWVGKTVPVAMSFRRVQRWQRYV